MIRAALALVLACWLLSGCAPDARPIPPGRPALWVIEDAAGDTAGWLFGTIHALPDAAQWRTPALEQAIAQAGELVVEVRDLDPARVAAAFAALSQDRPGPPLAQRLAPDARADLAEVLAREGVSAAPYDRLETWAAALALARLGDGAGSENGVDRALLAQFGPRPVRELEGAEEQLAIFDRLPERDQRVLLAAVIEEERGGEDQAADLAGAWLAGDIARMERLMRRGMLADPALYEALLARRNRAWAAQLAAVLDAKRRSLVAVGAAHMLGPDGLPALLAARGYRIRRIQ